ncbi:energy transducer TonB [Kordiimonas aestuarii]|uniref:energy transducer TonB n=1 Tax=Kordiimonas aestuarii TaxID=1005925 RepID=UPI0021D0825A|nr:energy transducer TonB [Kordiimonas aestuarii]
MKLTHLFTGTALTLSATFASIPAQALDADLYLAAASTIRKVPAMSLTVHKKIQAAQEAIADKDYPRAQAVLNETLRLTRINDYEKAVVWQLKAMIAFSENDSPATIEAYETILNYRDSIPEALEINILFGLAQLYHSQGDTRQAAEYANKTVYRMPTLSQAQSRFLAELYYLTRDFAKAEKHIEVAINAGQAYGGGGVKEVWYKMLLSSQWEQGHQLEAKKTALALISRWPEQKYCQILAGMMMEMRNTDEQMTLDEVRTNQAACADVTTTSPVENLYLDFQVAFEKARSTQAAKAQPAETDAKAKQPRRGQKDYLPVVRVQPQFPAKALRDGITDARVLISLDIEKDGSVNSRSIRILESNPAGYFEDSVKRAASKFKYKPEIVDGKAQRVEGVKYTFTFKVED